MDQHDANERRIRELEETLRRTEQEAEAGFAAVTAKLDSIQKQLAKFQPTPGGLRGWLIRLLS